MQRTDSRIHTPPPRFCGALTLGTFLVQGTFEVHILSHERRGRERSVQLSMFHLSKFVELLTREPVELSMFYVCKLVEFIARESIER